MKHIQHKIVAILLLVAASTATAQTQVPILLRQDLNLPLEDITVYDMTDVTVVSDTVDYISVLTYGTVEEADSLSFPSESMKLGGAAVTIRATFPYRSGISIHTSARQLSIRSTGNGFVELRSHDSDTVRLDMLKLGSYHHNSTLVTSPVRAVQVWMTVDDYASIRHSVIDCPDINRTVSGEGRISQVLVDDREPAYNFNIPVSAHRWFIGWSFGSSGWSEKPFGGMTAPMGDYAMGMTAVGLIEAKLGYNFLRTNHWDFGAGLSSYTEIFSFPGVIMSGTVNPASGLTHLGPVGEPSYYSSPYYAGTTRVWRSRIGSSYLQVPLRVEWHRRMDYKGLRIGVELRPGISLSGRTAIVVSEGDWMDDSKNTWVLCEGRTDLQTDTLGQLMNLTRCDLRIEVSWSQVSIFIQGALTPMYRTARKNDLPVLDTKIYPLTLGFCISY